MLPTHTPCHGIYLTYHGAYRWGDKPLVVTVERLVVTVERLLVTVERLVVTVERLVVTAERLAGQSPRPLSSPPKGAFIVNYQPSLVFRNRAGDGYHLALCASGGAGTTSPDYGASPVTSEAMWGLRSSRPGG